MRPERRKYERAIAIRCHSPTDSSVPPANAFPSSVSYPFGSLPINSLNPASRAAASISATELSRVRSLSVMFSRTEPWYATGSWNITVIDFRNSAGSKRRTSIPASSTRPDSGS
jgi:hypothetical protein